MGASYGGKELAGSIGVEEEEDCSAEEIARDNNSFQPDLAVDAFLSSELFQPQRYMEKERIAE